MSTGSTDIPVAVITGASSGIGRACARELSRRGYHVVLAARRKDELDRTLELCGGRGRSVVCDVTDSAQVRALAAGLAQHEGRCDVLVNNAGVGSRATFDGPGSMSVVRELTAINFTGAVECTAELLPLLRRADRPAIIAVSSVAGFVGFPGAPTYCASKFAMRGFFESLHYQLRRDGIHVVTVCPGPVPTEGWPHARLVSSGLRRRLLTADADRVARVIARAIHSKRAVVIVPRIYSALLWLTNVAPPLRALALRAMSGRPRDPIPADLERGART
jgi:short-subunit dehydrogenase